MVDTFLAVKSVMKVDKRESDTSASHVFQIASSKSMREIADSCCLKRIVGRGQGHEIIQRANGMDAKLGKNKTSAFSKILSNIFFSPD